MPERMGDMTTSKKMISNKGPCQAGGAAQESETALPFTVAEPHTCLLAARPKVASTNTPMNPPGGTSVPISLSRVFQAFEVQSRITPTGQKSGVRMRAPRSSQHG